MYRIEKEPEVYIDVNGLAELHGSDVNGDGIKLGANINLTEAMELFYKLAKDQPGQYTYCRTMADHIDLIANVPVRNVIFNMCLLQATTSLSVHSNVLLKV